MDGQSPSNSADEVDARFGMAPAPLRPKGYRVAIVWRGDHKAQCAPTPYNNRYRRVFEELLALGIDALPVIYADDIADEVREQLLTFDGVLVWVNPIDDGQTRQKLDDVLRQVATRGPWVSAHPDVILKMGVKEVLHRTKHLGWGTDTHLYRHVEDFWCGVPEHIAVERATRPKAEPRQWRSGGLEG